VKLRHYLGHEAKVGHDIELMFVQEGKEGSARFDLARLAMSCKSLRLAPTGYVPSIFRD
jgi:hypothetical protein